MNSRSTHYEPWNPRMQLDRETYARRIAKRLHALEQGRQAEAEHATPSTLRGNTAGVRLFGVEAPDTSMHPASARSNLLTDKEYTVRGFKGPQSYSIFTLGSIS